MDTECKEMVNKIKKEIELKSKTVDLYIRKNPYESIAVGGSICFALGLGLGVLLGKK